MREVARTVGEKVASILKSRGVSSDSRPALVKKNGDEQFPRLSFAQERLWILHQLEPSTAAYNVSSQINVSGKISIEALEKALTAIVRRHEVLRTSFEDTPEGPIRSNRRTTPETIPIVDIGDFHVNDMPTRVREIVREEARRPFDLTKPQPIRLSLVRLSRERHLLLVTMHHIVADGWSVRILLEEMALLYQAFVMGDPSPLPSLPLQYSDYASWQRDWLQGSNSSAS